jgi:hypothetical protein
MPADLRINVWSCQDNFTKSYRLIFDGNILAARSGATQIDIIAHSMGNQALMAALQAPRRVRRGGGPH